MTEIWYQIWNQIKELCKVSFKDIKPAVKQLGIDLCNILSSFLKLVWTTVVGTINGILSLVGTGLVASWKWLMDKWF